MRVSGPVDAGGGDLQRPGGVDRVFHVHHGGEQCADLLAILEREGGAIGAVGHDLHGRGLGAHHLHADQLIALGFQRLDDDVGNAALKAGMDGAVIGQTAKYPTKKAAR